MKRIAVLFFGQPRQLEKGAEFIKPFFDLSQADIQTDYFFHSWTMVDPKKTNRIYEVGHEDQETLQSEMLSGRITELYNPVSVEISNPITDEDFTKKAQQFVNLWESIEKTEYFLETKSAHGFLSHEPLVKYKIGQLVSSERVVQNKKDYEKKYDFEYDIVFRIRTDMAYKPSLLEDRLKYIDNGLKFIDHADRDLNQIYVDYLKISNGVPLCGDQNVWGKSKSIDRLFTGCTNSFLKYTEKLLNRCSEGYYKEDCDFVRGRFLHIEIAIPVAAMDHDCSMFSILNGPNAAGSHALIRDTVDLTDDYQTVHEKHCDFFK
tara:strand:- start:165 stop:1121 length:957 start_codon:yes stop_codon:yes gene_type:complete